MNSEVHAARGSQKVMFLALLAGASLSPAAASPDRHATRPGPATGAVIAGFRLSATLAERCVAGEAADVTR